MNRSLQRTLTFLFVIVCHQLNTLEAVTLFVVKPHLSSIKSIKRNTSGTVRLQLKQATQDTWEQLFDWHHEVEPSNEDVTMRSDGTITLNGKRLKEIVAEDYEVSVDEFELFQASFHNEASRQSPALELELHPAYKIENDQTIVLHEGKIKLVALPLLRAELFFPTSLRRSTGNLLAISYLSECHLLNSKLSELDLIWKNHFRNVRDSALQASRNELLQRLFNTTKSYEKVIGYLYGTDNKKDKYCLLELLNDLKPCFIR